MSFTVTTVRETGTITYHCATPHFALEKVQDFRRAEYQAITVCDASDRIVAEGVLMRLAAREGRPAE